MLAGLQLEAAEPQRFARTRRDHIATVGASHVEAASCLFTGGAVCQRGSARMGISGSSTKRDSSFWRTFHNAFKTPRFGSRKVALTGRNARSTPIITLKGATMKKLHAVATFMLLVAGTASAGETGIINQAGPYEAQMRFYLHPAHGFPGTPESAARNPSAVDSKASVGGDGPAARHTASASKPASRASHPADHPSNRVAAVERVQ